MPANLFGLCTGLRNNPSGGPAVTEWLHERIQMLAGLPSDTPLTFGMLWDVGRDKPAESSARSDVNLQVVTSCLSHGQPYTLPFEGELFAFKEDELALILPDEVMKHLITPDDEIRAYCKLPEGYHFLPEARQLPVLLAARMSLSFPLLFSGVPLYAIRHDRGVLARTSGATVTLNPADRPATAVVQRRRNLQQLPDSLLRWLAAATSHLRNQPDRSPEGQHQARAESASST